MKSYQFREYGKHLESIEHPEPSPEGTEVLVRVLACGACHSDVHLWEGEYDLGNERKLDARSGRDLPFTLGHEISGEVVRVGPDAQDTLIGKRFVVFPWIGCGTCNICDREAEHLCLRPRALGTFVDGGYSDHVLVPHPKYLFDFGNLKPELACTYACSGLTAYSAAKKVIGHHGSHIVIIGAGGVGLSALMIVKATTDYEIIVADIRKEARDAAEQAGANHTLDANDKNAHRLIKKMSRGGACAVVDCVGSEASANLGMRSLAKSGILIIVGLFGGALQVSLPLLPLKDITIRGSDLGSLSEMGELMELARAGRIDPIPIKTRALEQAQKTLYDLGEGNLVGRVVLEP